MPGSLELMPGSLELMPGSLGALEPAAWGLSASPAQVCRSPDGRLRGP